MTFNYQYTVQFRDTDAAGVVYFANILSICHIAYEASLVGSAIDLKDLVNNTEFAVPIASTSANFYQPMYCGERVIIELTPIAIDNFSFEINYRILAADLPSADRQSLIAVATTKHVVIDRQTRQRRELSVELTNWLNQWQNRSEC